MRPHRHRLVVFTLLAVWVTAGGCDTQQQKKDQLAKQWQKTAAPTKLTTAEAMLERGQLDQADKILQEIFSSNTANAAAYVLRGRLNALRGAVDAADRDFVVAIEQDPTLDKAWAYRAAIAVNRRDWQTALECYSQALALKPNVLEYRLGLAESCIAVGDTAQAIQTMQQGVAANPTDSATLAGAADIYSRCGRLNEAVELYEKCALLEPANSTYAEALAYAYAAQGQWDKATDHFHRLLSLVEDASQKQAILETLASCAMNAQRYGLAVNCYDRLVIQRRTDAEVWLALANAALGAHLYTRAENAARKALQYRPGCPKATASLGAALYLQQRYDAALAQFTQLQKDEQLASFGWFMAGQCWQKLGQSAKAQLAFKKAAEQPASSLLVERLLKNQANAL